MQAARDQAQEESALKSREIFRLEGEVATHLQTIAECKARIREDEMVRRRLHNTIQELKGTGFYSLLTSAISSCVLCFALQMKHNFVQLKFGLLPACK